ncbi:thioesterase family protein [Mycolicibacterium aubagnense]|uniref:Thioesterase n=1 Tax=Mycolicibacterium aubagnense TaxID=319707 RepID=A0ABN5Z0H5_9MYCO|nr:thioesterase family protein [Mycolicibacterium aubagnense]TLH65238.1 thioesterase family protein [Mycolicibacterium aubagnense]WGI31160.1 thioesterase family protein [Mycolicibacterium aubagnense]BBX87448.1 thioesterase [Mycolicibacterium aubagnense]
MIDCYYRRRGADGDLQRFESTEGTGSNWDANIQHGSPPLALLTKSIEELAAGSGMQVGRLTLDILGAIPVAPVAVRAWVSRPGSRICMMTAEMTAAQPDGSERAVARMSTWLIAPSDTRDAVLDRYPPMTQVPDTGFRHHWQGRPGYLETVTWVPQPDDANASVVWMRPLISLVDDEEMTDLQRLAMVVDSANGVGAELDPNEFVFMNTDTTVHLHRTPVGPEFCLRARGSIGPDGLGSTTAELFDKQGFIGTSAQTLLVQRR